MSLQYLEKKVIDEVDFLHADKYQVSFKLDFNTLSIKVSYKVILSLLIGMIKHSWRTQSNRIAISLQYLKKEIKNGVHFLHADKHQSFKVALLFLMEVARYFHIGTFPKLVTFFQHFRKKVLQLLLCFVLMQNIQIFCGGSSHVHCYLLLFLYFYLKTMNILQSKFRRLIQKSLTSL